MNGVPLSIIAIGMGTPMMDFLVREVRAIVTGPMAVVRFGTCGGFAEAALAGSIVSTRVLAWWVRGSSGWAGLHAWAR